MSAALAQPAPAAGTLIAPQRSLQDLAPRTVPRLSPGLGGTRTRPAPAPADAGDITIRDAEVSGSDVLPPARFSPLLQPLIGRSVTLAEIEEARAGILASYRAAGFLFVSVTPSIQRAPEGARLRFLVQEGRVARVRLDNDIGPAGTQVLRFLRQAISEGPATARAIERALLLAGDVPGVTVRGVLRPLEGGAPGDLELVAEVTRAAFSGYLSGDNRAFRFTGPLQFLTVAQANSFTSFGERTEASFFTSGGAEAVFGQASNEFFVGSSGLRVRLYAGAGRTNPTGALAEIGYAGFTWLAGAGASYPILRSRPANLFAVAQFDVFDNTVDGGTTQTIQLSRDSIRALRLGFDGQALDSLLPFAPSATTLGSVRFHQGISGLGATQANATPGPARAGSDFGFAKATGELQRTQPVLTLSPTAWLAVQGLVAGQWSNDVLPAAEKFFLGGTRLGRGFYVGQVNGDRGVGVAVELQLNLSFDPVALAPAGGTPVELRPSTQFYGFYDAGRTWENLVTDPNRRLESWGGGARLNINDRFYLDLEGVRRITRQVDAAGTAAKPLPATAGYARVLVRF